MKIVLLLALIGACAAARLENTYLPPQHAQSSGGSGNFLRTPSAGHGPHRPPTSSYISPAKSAGPPSTSYGAPQQYSKPAQPPVPILRYNNDYSGEGHFKYDFETGNGITQEAQGELIGAGSDNEQLVIRGSYSYTGPDNVVYTVHYTADENGYHAEGDHIPKAPQAILDSIQRNAHEESSGYSSGPQQHHQQQSTHHQSRPNNQYLAPARSGSYSEKSGYQY